MKANGRAARPLPAPEPREGTNDLDRGAAPRHPGGGRRQRVFDSRAPRLSSRTCPARSRGSERALGEAVDACVSAARRPGSSIAWQDQPQPRERPRHRRGLGRPRRGPAPRLVCRHRRARHRQPATSKLAFHDQGRDRPRPVEAPPRQLGARRAAVGRRAAECSPAVTPDRLPPRRAADASLAVDSRAAAQGAARRSKLRRRRRPARARSPAAFGWSHSTDAADPRQRGRTWVSPEPARLRQREGAPGDRQPRTCSTPRRPRARARRRPDRRH